MQHGIERPAELVEQLVRSERPGVAVRVPDEQEVRMGHPHLMARLASLARHVSC